VNVLGALAARGVASSVSGKPASQTPQQAAKNIAEEVGGSASDIARAIAGGNMTSDAVTPGNRTFLGITSSVASSVPQPYIVFGLAGALPYLFASGSTVYFARQAGMAAQGLSTTRVDFDVALDALHHALTVQTTYGAVLLSFLGALHWGFEFAGYGGHKGYPRLFLGAAPVLYAWPTLALEPTWGLIAQWVGFTGLWYADLKATGAGWTPKWYSQYRFYLSILVGTCIIGSLAGESYFGPVAGHGERAAYLNRIRSERKQKDLEHAGTIPGDIEAVPAPPDADAYVLVKHKDAPPAEDEEEKEGAKGDEVAKSDAGKKGQDKDKAVDPKKGDNASKGENAKAKEEPKKQESDKGQNDAKGASKDEGSDKKSEKKQK
jgi:hypothetical protein